MSQFVGREYELAELHRFTQKKSASFIVVRGRRRIGKSRLIEEFAKKYLFYSFAGLVPQQETTAQSQRDEFSKQLHRETNLPQVKVDDWGALFQLLGEKLKTTSKRVVVLFDEISWMGSKDPDFLGKLKHAWDTLFKKNHQLIFVLCGSASSWIEENILNNTGFVGRISYTLTMEEMPLNDGKKFWGSHENNISAYEKLKLLSVTGCIPKYLEEINPKLSAEDNIKHLCFTKGGLLVDEFNNLFSSTFLRKSDAYQKIVNALCYGQKSLEEICACLGMDYSGRISSYLNELELCGFIRREYSWHIKTGKDSKLSHYRLSDNYLRFYLRYIAPQLSRIQRNAYQHKPLSSLKEWSTIIGLQFENLVIKNHRFLCETLQISPNDIIVDGPFFQKPSARQKGCQVDYLIQTKHQTLYVCEIKFSKDLIGEVVVKEMQEKINRISKPKSFSCRPVLIHVNGVTTDLADQDYFTNIVDFSNAL